MGKQFVLLCPKSKGRSWTVNLNFFFFSSEVGITLPSLTRRNMFRLVLTALHAVPESSQTSMQLLQ